MMLRRIARGIRQRWAPPRCYDCGGKLPPAHLTFQRVISVHTGPFLMRLEVVALRFCRSCATHERVTQLTAQRSAS